MDNHVNGKAAAPVSAENDQTVATDINIREVIRRVAFIHRVSLERLAAYDRGEVEYVRRTKAD